MILSAMTDAAHLVQALVFTLDTFLEGSVDAQRRQDRTPYSIDLIGKQIYQHAVYYKL